MVGIFARKGRIEQQFLTYGHVNVLFLEVKRHFADDASQISDWIAQVIAEAKVSVQTQVQTWGYADISKHAPLRIQFAAMMYESLGSWQMCKLFISLNLR